MHTVSKISWNKVYNLPERWLNQSQQTKMHSCQSFRNKIHTAICLMWNYTILSGTKQVHLPCRNWRPDPVHRHCGRTHWAPLQSCGWPPDMPSCYHWRQHRCRNTILHTFCTLFWNYGTEKKNVHMIIMICSSYH